MTQPQPLGPVLHSFFASHLITVKGLRPASVRSYRDTVRLFLLFTAADKGCKITRLTLSDLTFDRVVGFLRHLEQDRGNHASTRNQRLAALHCLFDYLARRAPEMLATGQQVAAIPVKRAAPPETRFLERDEIEDLLRHLPRDGPLALRDRTLILFLYNTGARAQEAADLRTGTPRPRQAPAGAAARQGRQVADLPALAGDSTPARRPARPARPAAHVPGSGVLRTRAAPHPLRHLQDHPAARSPLRRPAHRTAGHPAHAAALCGRPCYVAGSSISAGSRAARAGSGHITPVCYSQKRSSHARRSWSAVQSGRGSGVSDW